MTHNSTRHFQGDLLFQELVDAYTGNPRFLRRDWLAADVDERLREPDCRFVLLTAEPGAGKSAFMAQLADDHRLGAQGGGWLRYFIRRDQKEVLGDVGARAFLLRIGFQLAAFRPELFATEQIQINVEQRIGNVENRANVIGAEIDRVVNSPFHQMVLRIQQEIQRVSGRVIGLRVREFMTDPQAFDESQLQNMALFDPARVLARLHPDAQIVVLIDALDELRYCNTESNLRTVLDWLIDSPQDALPANVRFVVTSRPPEGRLVTFIEKHSLLRRLTIDSADNRVQGDMQTYASRLVEPPDVAEVLTGMPAGAAGFVAEAVSKADGNIGYLDALARGIDHARSLPGGGEGLAELLALQTLPDHISGLYTLFLHQIKSRPGSTYVNLRDPLTGRTGLGEAWPNLYAPLLAVLAVALEPPTLDQLRVLSGTLADRSAVVTAIDWLSQFLDRLGDRYRLYHPSLAEFLVADSTHNDPNSSDLYVEPIGTHRQIARVLGQDPDNLWADTGEDAAEQGRRLYARRYYVYHLYLGRDWNQLFAVIDAGKYGQGKLRFDSSTYSYARDLDLARDASMRSGAAQAELMALLPRLWRYSLLRCSLASNAGMLPPDAFAVLSVLGKVDQATGLAQLTAAPESQALAFGRIAGILAQMPGSQDQPARLLRDAYAAAGRVLDPGRRADLLATLVDMTQFMFDNAQFFDPQAVDAATQLARQIPGALGRATALRSLVRYLYHAGQRRAAAELVIEMEQTLASAGKPREAEGVRSNLAGAYAELEDWERSRQTAAGLENLIARADTLAYLATRQYQAGAAEAAKETVGQTLALACDAGLDPITQGRILFAVSQAPAACDPERRLGQLLHAAVDRLQGQDPCTLNPRFWIDVAATSMRLGEQGSVVELLGRAKTCIIDCLRAQEPTIGPTTSFFLPLVEATLDMARLGEWQMAREVATFLPPSDRLSVLAGIVEALVGAGDWDKALEFADEIGRVEASTPFRIFISSSSPIKDPRPMALYRIVQGLADQRDWVRAIEVAERIDQLDARCQALSRIALMQLLAGDNRLAAETLAKQDRTIRLWPTRGDKDKILSASVNMLVRTGAWADARVIASQIGTADGRSTARKAIAGALIAADDRTTLDAVVAEMEDPAGRASARTALALKLKEAAKDQAASAALAEARDQALQIEDGATRSAALRKIAVTLAAWGDADTAKQVLFQAAEAWNKAKPFPTSPTPVSDLCVDAARVGMWDFALRIAHGLVDHDAFDGATALRNLAVYCHQIGRDDQATGLLAEAEQAALKIGFPPQRMQIETRNAATYAETGLGDGASSAETLPEPLRPDAFVYVAEVLAKAGIPTEAMAELGKLRSATGRIMLADVDRAQRAIITAWLAAGDTSQALTVAEAITDERQQVEGLAEIGGRLLELGQRDDALRILGQASDLARERNAVWTGTALTLIVEHLAKAGEYRLSMTLVQGEWRRNDNSRWQLLERLPMAGALVPRCVDLGKGIYQSADWVESFLAGV